MNHDATPNIVSTHRPLLCILRTRHWCIPARRMRSIAWLALLCALILLPRDLITPAEAGDRSSGRFYMTGQMWTRNLVRGPQGQPIFAEFAPDGTPIKEIGEAINEPLEHATVMAANDYRLEVARYDDLKARFNTTDAKGHAILNRDAYTASAFKTLREGYTINKSPLQPSTRSVVVRGALTLLTVGTNPVLLESTINLNSIDRDVVGDTKLKSLLIDAKGNVLYKTANNYGYRVSDIKQKSGESDPLCRPAYGIERDRDGYSPTQDALCGPVLGAHVETQIFPGQYGGTLTGEQGRWAITYFKSPCPGFDYRYTTDFYQTLFYTNFNPKGSALGQYFQRDEWADWCRGLSEGDFGTSLGGVMTGLAVSAIENSTAEAPRHMVNYVDVAAISGLAKFGNGLNPLDAIPGGTEATQYQTNLPTFTPRRAADLGLSFDFDGDQIPDPMDPAPVDYNHDGRAEEIGFYLNGKQPGDKDAQGNPIPPDLIRRLDTLPDYQHQGLLKNISQQDMKETDLYIYRMSNGQKIQERKGLNDINLYKDGSSNVSYLSLLRGPRALSQFFGRNFSDWQSATGINPALHVKQADHLRVGEPLKIILVNRRTGYIGTTLTQMPAATSGSIDFPIQPIVMRPPNLKLKAQRQYDIEAGLTKDKERNYLIGFEGASLQSDTYVQVTTDWFDHDGTPLPGDLPGYTGRLAKITSDKTLDGNAVAQFAIHPGSHQQLVRLSQQEIGTEHYYIHVNGEPADGSPDFTTLGSEANDEVLKKRPKHYVPVLVPVYDEAETTRRKNEQLYALQSGQLTPQQKTKIEPVHRWVYRPEMQFSVLDLDVKNIYRTDADNNVLDILPPGKDNDENTIPGLATGDSLVQILFDLYVNTNDPLDPFGYINPDIKTTNPYNTTGHDFIFQLGQDEALATVGTNQTVQFYNLNHLAALTPEDYLTINLLQNTDAGNVLWEFAFETLVLESQLVSSDPWVGDTYVVTADDPTVPLIAHLVGYGLRDPENQQEVTTRWSVEGSGSMQTPVITNKDGVFTNMLTMPHAAGSTGIVRAGLIAEPEIVAKFAKVEVVPGAPAVIQIETVGKASIAQVGRVDVTIRAWDKWGNAVTDGTSLEASIEGDAHVYPDVAFKDGVAEAVIEGGLEAGTPNLIVKVGDVTQQQPIQIHDLNLAITMGNTLTPGQLSTVQVRVTTVDGGAPVPPVHVELASTVGMLQNNMMTTGADGTVLTYLHPGLYGNTSGKLSAIVNLTRATHNFTVTMPADEAQFSAKGAVVMGSHSADGNLSVPRYDGTNVVLSYKTAASVTVGGTPGETVNVTLGNVHEPAIEPLRLLELNQPEFVDLVTGQQAQGLGITLVNSHPKQIGKSAAFNGGQQLTLSPDPALNLANNIGFNLAFYPQTAAGTLVDYEHGTQTLVLNSDATLRYSVKTATGTYSVNSAPIALNQWHRIAVRYSNGTLQLTVDASTTTASATGDLIYTYPSTGIALGQGATGYLSGMRVYNTNAPSLLKFANNQQSISVTIDATGQLSVPVQSTGQLGKLIPASALPALAVAIEAKGVTRHVSLMSEAAFATFGVQYLENLYDGPPPPLAQSTPERLLNFVIPAAHAGLFDDVWDGLKTVTEFLIPIGAIGELGTQLKHLATGDAKFDATKMIFSSLEVLTIFPIAKPLLPIVKLGGKMGGPIVKLLERFRHYNTIKYLADYVGTAAKHVIDSRSFDKFVVLLPFFITVGEMYVENPESVEIMLKSIGSAADLEGWIGFLFLPTEDDAAQVAANYMSDPTQAGTQVAGLSSFLIKDANAISLHSLRRISGTIFAKVVAQMPAQLREIIQEDPKILSKIFREAYVSVRRIDGKDIAAHIKEVRQYLTDPKAIVAMAAIASRAGAGSLRRFLTDQNRRIGLLETIAIIGYLEARMSSFDAQVQPQIKSLIKKAFVTLIFDDDIGGAKKPKPSNRSTDQCPTDNEAEDDDADQNEVVAIDVPPAAKKSKGNFWEWIKSHGALYHLSQIAILDAQQQRIAAVEAVRNVDVVAGTVKPHSYQRVVDIVIAAEEDAPESSEKWVEVKSYGRDSGSRKEVYKVGYASNRLHPLQRKWDTLGVNDYSVPIRQYYLDRIHARKDSGFENRMQWRFHDFEKKGKGKCAGKNIYGLEKSDVAWIRTNYFDWFKNKPGALSNAEVRKQTFKLAKIKDWDEYNKDYNKQLEGMVIAASTRDILTIAEFKAYVPKLAEWVIENLDQ